MDLRNHQRRRREHPDMEMTPLIDIVFLLLIFFMMTSSFSESAGQESEFPIELPEAVSGQESGQNETVTLFVTGEGEVEMRGSRELSGETVTEKLTNLNEQSPEIGILLKGDKGASHGRIMDVLDEIKQAGFTKVNLVTTQAEN